LNNIGRVLLMMSQIQESEKYLRQAIQQDPNLAPAYHNLVVVLLRRALEGQSLSVNAVQCAKRAADIGPPSVDLYRDVAALLALAARRDSTLVQQSVGHLDQAVACGLDPRTAAKDPVFAVLHRDSAFQELLTKKPSLPSPLRGNYLVEP
jgi:tetratricopeptide (TPR) repeat protein